MLRVRRRRDAESDAESAYATRGKKNDCRKSRAPLRPSSLMAPSFHLLSLFRVTLAGLKCVTAAFFLSLHCRNY